MSTFTLQIPADQVGLFEQMVRSMGWGFSISESTESSSVAKRQTVTPAMRRQINRARKEHTTGQTRICRTPQEMQQYFDSL